MRAPPSLPSPPGDLAGLAALADRIGDLVWAWDLRSRRMLYANRAFQRTFGAPQPADPVELLLDRVAAADVQRLRAARARLPGLAFAEEYGVEPVAGSRRLRLREEAFAVPGPGTAGLVLHLARDVSWQFDTTAQLRAEISRRTDAERSLHDANARLQMLLATANDAVITIDPDSRIIDWNQAAERMFGYPRPEALGQVMTDLIIPPAFRAAHQAGIERFLHDGTGQIFNRRVEARALRRSGEEFDVELSIWPVRTDDGWTFSSFVRDISRRKAAARALAESEAKYRQVVENVNEGILVTAHGRILFANPRALALTGMDAQQARATPFVEFIHPEDRERVLGNHLRRLRGEPVENHYQFRVLHREGSIRWLEISAVVFEWQGAAATLNFLTDVTQRRQAEEDMRHALARERELSELKSRFVAVASHEFRTPLSAILSSVELLDDYGARLPESERREIVGLIKTAVSRMNGMIEQVLLTSKLEAGRLAFDPEPRVVPVLLAQLAAELDQANPQAGRVAMHCEGLGEAPRLVDAQLVRHILTNLLGNALKYSPADTEVACRVGADGDWLTLTVSDRGIGIPPQDLPLLFQTFHRGTNVGNIQGTGIGLNIVRECVQLHQGRIAVDSTPGSGTTFRVHLFAPPGPEQPAAAPAAAGIGTMAG